MMFLAIAVNSPIFRQPKFQGLLLLACGCSPRAFTRAVEYGFGINRFDRSLLKFNRIASAFDREIDQLLRNIQITVMVDTDFSDDVDLLHVFTHYLLGETVQPAM